MLGLGIKLVRSPGRRVRDQQIEEAIVVIVEENGGLGMADAVQSGFLGDILKLAVAQIAKEHVTTARAGDEQIWMAVVIIVSPGGGHADAVAQGDTSVFRHVYEGAVPFVEVEGVLAELVDEIDVVETIAVVIGYRHAAAVSVKVGFEFLALLARKKFHAKFDPGLVSRLPEASRPAAWLFRYRGSESDDYDDTAKGSPPTSVAKERGGHRRSLLP